MKIFPTTNPFRIDFPNIVIESGPNRKKRDLKTYFYMTEAIFEKGTPDNSPWFLTITVDIPAYYNIYSNKESVLAIVPKREVFNNQIHQYRKENTAIDKIEIGRRDSITITILDQSQKAINLSDYSLNYLGFRLFSE